jgi:hypothetical protein
MSDNPHFVDDAMRQAIRARIVELHDRHGLTAFRLPGVQQAIDLLLDADSATRLNGREAEATARPA